MRIAKLFAITVIAAAFGLPATSAHAAPAAPSVASAPTLAMGGYKAGYYNGFNAGARDAQTTCAFHPRKFQGPYAEGGEQWVQGYYAGYRAGFAAAGRHCSKTLTGGLKR